MVFYSTSNTGSEKVSLAFTTGPEKSCVISLKRLHLMVNLCLQPQGAANLNHQEHVSQAFRLFPSLVYYLCFPFAFC